jgi:hypothetical protein
MSFDIGRVRHLAEQMHRSEDDAGDPITDGFLLAAAGDSGMKWTDPASLTPGPVVPFDHGSMGSTETFDLDDGTWHRGTLTANCTTTVTGFTVDEGVVMLLEIEQDGTGGWDITWDADVDFGGADDQPNQTAGSYTAFLLWSSVGDSTIYGAKVGAGSGSALTIEDDGTPLTTAADTLDFVGAGVTASGAGATKTITVPGVTEASVRDVGRWEVVVSGTAPPVAVSTPGDDDWVYAWVSG